MDTALQETIHQSQIEEGDNAAHDNQEAFLETFEMPVVSLPHARVEDNQ